MSKFIDLTGTTFGRLKVVQFIGRPNNHSVFKCVCTCGTEVQVLSNNLRRGMTTSCGCLWRGSITKHGGASDSGRTYGYESWRMMRQRCTNPKYTQYKDYGGRGITICKRWDDFAKFMEDMGTRPPGLTLERKDVDGNYEPSNCKWATVQEQNQNRR